MDSPIKEPIDPKSTPTRLFAAQLDALLRKSVLIYTRNRGSIFKELLLPIVTSICIYANQFTQNSAMPVIILFPVSLMGHVRSFMVDVVHEKSEKYREYLKINGVSSSAYIFSVLVFGYFKALIFTVVTCSSFLFVNSKAFEFPVMTVILLYFLTAIACTHFALLITAFFSSRQLCSDIGGIAFTLLSYLFLIAYETKSRVWYYISLIFPQNALAYTLFNPEQSSLDLRPKDYDWSAELAGFVILDSVLFLVLYFYFNEVIPDKYGVKRRPLFCLKNCCKRRLKAAKQPELTPVMGTEMNTFTEEEVMDGVITTRRDLFSMEHLGEDDTSSAVHHQKFENPADLRRTIFLDKISKTFGNEKVIDTLSLMLYEKQIFCLLGHNGAGKTTTINLLTGLLDYKEGDILYGNHSFREDVSRVRKTIGLCGQQDVLYPDLTVEEHMYMVGRIRGRSDTELQSEVQTIIQRIGLETERRKPARDLSGGNRRKLSLGLAVLGDVRIIFLDEPTAGMDPSTRRSIWGLIKELKDEGKTIVLTTHHLDEADELSDRLGVMSKGKLFAVGSSDYIKKKFGVGYHLIITPNYERNITVEHFESLRPRIFEVIHQFIENVSQEDKDASGVIKYMLPFSYQKIFPQLFEELEKIENIKLNLKMNSLEDAFINIGLQDDLLFKQDFKNELATQSIINVEPPQSVRDFIPKYSFPKQLKAMFLRKYLFTLRSYKKLVLIILPLVFVIFGTMGTVWRLRALESGATDASSTNQEDLIIESAIVMLFLFFVNFAYSLNATVYCVFPVYERETHIAYAMRVMGCRDLPYWLGTFLFDFIAVQIVNITLVALVFIFKIRYLEDDAGLLIGALETYSGALVTTSYFWGFVFKTSNAVLKSYTAFYLFALYTLPTAGLALLSYFIGSSTLTKIVTVLAFHLCPNFAFNDLIKLILNQPAIFFESPQHCILWLLWLAVFYMLLCVIIQKRVFKVRLSPSQAAQDPHLEYRSSVDNTEMTAEANRVRGSDNDDPVKILNLTKVYKNGFRAVRGVSFGIQSGEIFGLLGPNGAGKSTTFHICTAMIPRTSGRVDLKNNSIDGSLDKVFEEVGVCPQTDALWEDLRVDEHLALYSNIKGANKLEREETIEYLLDALKLRDDQAKRAKELSGGTKRKLSTAISLVGSPFLKFLDEPSTGLDPLAKRFLWSCLRNSAAMKDGSMMLTTHSMEEAEALCHRIGIIVNGKFVCVGPLEYLKDKYGSGYKVTVVKTEDMEDVGGYINDIFPNAVKIQDGATTTETYQIVGQSFKFSRALRALEGLKRGRAIKDFSIYNTTLEQVFINFSKEQQEPDPNMVV